MAIAFASQAQTYPALTQNITFDQLQKRSIERKVFWTNPDGSREQLDFIELFIPIDDEMIRKTKQFMKSVYGRDSIWLRPRMIVFHAMGDGDFKTSLEVSSFLNDEIPSSWGTLSKAGALPNGAHFIVDRDGKIYCLTPPIDENGDVAYNRASHRWYVKRHQDANPVAIGIENVTPKNNYTQLTDAQLASNVKLARWLITFERNEIAFIASHDQFNDEGAYKKFLDGFHLQNLKKEFRTRGREDIGDSNVTKLLSQIRSRGYLTRIFFDH